MAISQRTQEFANWLAEVGGPDIDAAVLQQIHDLEGEFVKARTSQRKKAREEKLVERLRHHEAAAAALREAMEARPQPVPSVAPERETGLRLVSSQETVEDTPEESKFDGAAEEWELPEGTMDLTPGAEPGPGNLDGTQKFDDF